MGFPGGASGKETAYSAEDLREVCSMSRLQPTMLCYVTRSCLTLWDPGTAARQAPLSMGILLARMLEWGAMPSSRESS